LKSFIGVEENFVMDALINFKPVEKFEKRQDIITILFVLKVHQTHYNIPQKISKITSNEEEERNY